MSLFLLYLYLPFQLLTGQAQGTTYNIKYVAETAIVHQTELDSIFNEIDQSLSLYLPHSRINMFNQKGCVEMDLHMKKVILASLECYHLSKGAFDITTASISTAWGFAVKREQKIPDKKAIQLALSVTGSHLLQLKEDTLIALKKGVKIDCNGIAQGYTVDVIAAFLASKGLTQFMVELGGEIYVKGDHPETIDWNIGVESAKPITGNWYPIQERLKVKDIAITTSGVNRNSYNINGRSYSHIIHPQKGTPIQNNIRAVTVLASNAMTADAWDNALLVMGIKKIKKILLKKPELQILVVYSNSKGVLQTFTNIKKGRLSDSLYE